MSKPSVPQTPSTTAEVFLRTVLRSGLLDRAGLQTALRGVPMELRADPEALAEHLVKNGQLSRFQARKLLEGTAMGLVLGPFQILAPIARGGMGTVYLARDSRSGQLLALKILPPRKAREEARLLARFRREMEMNQRVAHPHIAWTCEVGVCQGVYYIAMEFIPGRSLYRVVADEGPLKAARAARLFAEIASALDHAHSQGLIHRDLKPSNILITPNDHAKLLDLGLALMEGEEGAGTHREVIGGKGYVVGTMDYIAPEQAENAAGVDARSDLYALGCTFYHSLTGRPPFLGGSPRDKIHRHKTEAPEPLTQINPAVPPAFAKLVHRMMAKKPQDRPTSAAWVREQLLMWTGDDPVLPLDQPGDTAFQEAVAYLETAEKEPDTSEEGSVEEPPLPMAKVVLIEEVLPAAQGQPIKAAALARNRNGRPKASTPEDEESLWALPAKKTIPLWAWLVATGSAFAIVVLVILTK